MAVSRPIKELLLGLGIVSAAIIVARIAILGLLTLPPASIVDSAFGYIRLARESMELIPSVAAASHNAILFWGGSVTRLGFSESVFEVEAQRRSLSLKSFMFAYPLASPSSQIFLASRVQENLKTSNGKIQIAAIELAPDMLTKNWQVKFNNPVMLRQEMFMKPYELLATFFAAPQRAMTISRIKVLGGVSPEIMTNIVDTTFFALINYDKKKLKRKFEIPGGLLKPSKKTESELDFDETEISIFLIFIDLLKSISEKTIIYIPPFDSEWLSRSAESWKRFENLKSMITEKTGVRILDYSKDPNYSDRDFVEAVHFTPSSVPKFSKLVTDGILNAVY